MIILTFIQLNQWTEFWGANTKARNHYLFIEWAMWSYKIVSFAAVGGGELGAVFY